MNDINKLFDNLKIEHTDHVDQAIDLALAEQAQIRKYRHSIDQLRKAVKHLRKVAYNSDIKLVGQDNVQQAQRACTALEQFLSTQNG